MGSIYNLVFDTNRPSTFYRYTDNTGPNENLPPKAEADIISNASIIYDGTVIDSVDANGNKLPLIQQNDTLYIPIRTVSVLASMDIAWVAVDKTQTIYLRTPMDESQLGIVTSYIDSCGVLIDDISKEIRNLRETDPKNQQALLACIENLKIEIATISNIDQPKISFTNAATENIGSRVNALSDSILELQSIITNTDSLITEKSNIIQKCLDIETLGDLLQSEISLLREAFSQRGYPF